MFPIARMGFLQNFACLQSSPLQSSSSTSLNFLQMQYGSSLNEGDGSMRGWRNVLTEEDGILGGESSPGVKEKEKEIGVRGEVGCEAIVRSGQLAGGCRGKLNQDKKIKEKAGKQREKGYQFGSDMQVQEEVLEKISFDRYQWGQQHQHQHRQMTHQGYQHKKDQFNQQQQQQQQQPQVSQPQLSQLQLQIQSPKPPRHPTSACPVPLHSSSASNLPSMLIGRRALISVKYIEPNNQDLEQKLSTQRLLQQQEQQHHGTRSQPISTMDRSFEHDVEDSRSKKREKNVNDNQNDFRHVMSNEPRCFVKEKGVDQAEWLEGDAHEYDREMSQVHQLNHNHSENALSSYFNLQLEEGQGDNIQGYLNHHYHEQKEDEQKDWLKDEEENSNMKDDTFDNEIYNQYRNRMKEIREMSKQSSVPTFRNGSTSKRSRQDMVIDNSALIIIRRQHSQQPTHSKPPQQDQHPVNDTKELQRLKNRIDSQQQQSLAKQPSSHNKKDIQTQLHKLGYEFEFIDRSFLSEEEEGKQGEEEDQMQRLVSGEGEGVSNRGGERQGQREREEERGRELVRERERCENLIPLIESSSKDRGDSNNSINNNNRISNNNSNNYHINNNNNPNSNTNPPTSSRSTLQLPSLPTTTPHPSSPQSQTQSVPSSIHPTSNPSPPHIPSLQLLHITDPQPPIPVTPHIGPIVSCPELPVVDVSVNSVRTVELGRVVEGEENGKGRGGNLVGGKGDYNRSSRSRSNNGGRRYFSRTNKSNNNISRNNNNDNQVADIHQNDNHNNDNTSTNPNPNNNPKHPKKQSALQYLKTHSYQPIPVPFPPKTLSISVRQVDLHIGSTPPIPPPIDPTTINPNQTSLLLLKLQQQSQHFQTIFAELRHQIAHLEQQRARLSDQLYEMHKQLTDMKIEALPKREELRELEEVNEKLACELFDMQERVLLAEGETEKVRGMLREAVGELEGVRQRVGQLQKQKRKGEEDDQQQQQLKKQLQQQQQHQQQHQNSQQQQQIPNLKQLQSHLHETHLHCQRLQLQTTQLTLQLRRQKQRVRQLEISAQHEWQEYTLKERALESEVKVMRYELGQLVQRGKKDGRRDGSNRSDKGCDKRSDNRSDDDYQNQQHCQYPEYNKNEQAIQQIIKQSLLKRQIHTQNRHTHTLNHQPPTLDSHPHPPQLLHHRIQKYRHNSYLNPQQQSHLTSALMRKNREVLMLSPRVERIRSRYCGSINRVSEEKESAKRVEIRVDTEGSKERGKRLGEEIRRGENRTRGDSRREGKENKQLQEETRSSVSVAKAIMVKNATMDGVSHRLERLREEVRKELVAK